jgi:hypothetical protein
MFLQNKFFKMEGSVRALTLQTAANVRCEDSYVNHRFEDGSELFAGKRRVFWCFVFCFVFLLTLPCSV